MIGNSYAVYITGHVFVNETIQGPMSAHNPYNEVSIPIPIERIVNSAPQIDRLPYKLIVPAGVTLTYSLGTPFDLQLDKFYVDKWGLTDTPVKDWIEFNNKTST